MCTEASVMFGLPLDSCDPIVDQLLVCVQDEELQDTVLEALSAWSATPTPTSTRASCWRSCSLTQC